MGGAVAVAVSLMVFPERAHGLGLAAAGRILEQMARVVPILCQEQHRVLAHVGQPESKVISLAIISVMTGINRKSPTAEFCHIVRCESLATGLNYLRLATGLNYLARPTSFRHEHLRFFISNNMAKFGGRKIPISARHFRTCREAITGSG